MLGLYKFTRVCVLALRCQATLRACKDGRREKTPHKMSSQEKTPQEKTPQKPPVEKTPHPISGLVEKTPHPIFRLVEKTPQLYRKPSFWNFDIFLFKLYSNPHPSTL